MNSNFRGSDVSLVIDGQVVGKAQSLSYDREIKSVGAETPPRPLPRFEGSFTARGGITYEGEELFNNLMKGSNVGFDIEVERVKYEPPRRLRSKKKRLVRKWRKKYTNTFSREVYKNCIIEGAGTNA